MKIRVKNSSKSATYFDTKTHKKKIVEINKKYLYMLLGWPYRVCGHTYTVQKPSESASQPLPLEYELAGGKRACSAIAAIDLSQRPHCQCMLPDASCQEIRLENSQILSLKILKFSLKPFLKFLGK
jgi:hypothetical protein